MAWLHDNGDENEYSQFEEDEAGEKDEGVLEETEEEVTISERPGIPEAPASVPKPKPHRPSVARTRQKGRTRRVITDLTRLAPARPDHLIL